MRILLGLGNPGPDYAGHRHNIGFWCADRLARRLGVRLTRGGGQVWEALGQCGGEPLVIAKPRTYMNRSGRAARMLLERHGAAAGDLLVAHDEVDLPLGQLRVKEGGGHGGHNGLRSIMDVLGGGEFIRVRLGVGRPASREADLAQWVLSDFARDEKDEAEALAERGADAVEAILARGLREAMNRFNSRGAGEARTDR